MGRPREFDVDAALWEAVKVFWRKGFSATTMQNLVDAMGVERGSLYRTFGGKEALFCKAVERYSRYQMEKMPRDLSPLQALQRWFANNVEDACAADLPSGCLVINSSIESPMLPPKVRALVDTHLGRLRSFFTGAVAAASAQGLLPAPVDAEQTGASLLAAIIGINVMARTGADRAQLEQMANAALAPLLPVSSA